MPLNLPDWERLSRYLSSRISPPCPAGYLLYRQGCRAMNRCTGIVVTQLHQGDKLKDDCMPRDGSVGRIEVGLCRTNSGDEFLPHLLQV